MIDEELDKGRYVVSSPEQETCGRAEESLVRDSAGVNAQVTYPIFWKTQSQQSYLRIDLVNPAQTC